MYIYIKIIVTLLQDCTKAVDLNRRNTKRWYDIKNMLSQDYVKDMMPQDGDTTSYQRLMYVQFCLLGESKNRYSKNKLLHKKGMLCTSIENQCRFSKYLYVYNLNFLLLATGSSLIRAARDVIVDKFLFRWLFQTLFQFHFQIQHLLCPTSFSIKAIYVLLVILF